MQICQEKNIKIGKSLSLNLSTLISMRWARKWAWNRKKRLGTEMLDIVYVHKNCNKKNAFARAARASLALALSFGGDKHAVFAKFCEKLRKIGFPAVSRHSGAISELSASKLVEINRLEANSGKIFFAYFLQIFLKIRVPSSFKRFRQQIRAPRIEISRNKSIGDNLFGEILAKFRLSFLVVVHSN